MPRMVACFDLTLTPWLLYNTMASIHLESTVFFVLFWIVVGDDDPLVFFNQDHSFIYINFHVFFSHLM